MREIKFRVYYPATREMNYEPEDGGRDNWSINDKISLLQSEYSILMQFTGLKDVTRRRIYEGDILEYVPWGMVSPVRDAVKWDSGRLAYRVDRSVEGYRVIGNIYENPELLK